MTYKDLVALMVFLVVMFGMIMVFTVVYERSKCDHVEVGEVTHNPFLQ